MKNSVAALIAVVLLAAGCGGTDNQAANEATAVDATTALHTLFDEHFERGLEMNPLRATSIGDYRFNDRLANSNSPEYIAAATAMDQEFLRSLPKMERGVLSYKDQLS